MALKKPKLRRLPKQPKTKTAESLKRYLQKLNEVEKENAQKMRPYLQERADIARLTKQVADKRRKISGAR